MDSPASAAPTPAPAAPQPARGGAKKWIFFVLRWTVAIVGIAWVVSKLNLHDHALVLFDEQRNVPEEVRVLGPTSDDAPEFQVVDPAGNTVTVPRSRLVNEPDRKAVTLLDGSSRRLLAYDLAGDINRATVRRVLVEDPATSHGAWVDPAQLKDFHLTVPHPRVEVGLITATKQANGTLLAWSLLIFPVCFILVAIRWHALLQPLGIKVSGYTCFVLFMVGNFYNTFLPGSTGGDVLKAIYIARHAPQRKTHAVLSVLVDRIIGLLGLVILGGTMSAYQYAAWRTAQPAGAHPDPVATKCLQVALGSLAILSAAAFGFYILFHPTLRKRFDPIVYKVPGERLQKHIRHAVEVMEAYRQRPALVFGALLVTIPIHITVVLSAMFAGKAFGLPIPTLYYFVAVPVIVLVGAIPISPQGAGVMEFFAIKLLEKHGASIGEALLLTLSIRVVQILWNLVGGIWVFTGGYHAPTEAEAHELDDEGPVPMIETPPGTA